MGAQVGPEDPLEGRRRTIISVKNDDASFYLLCRYRPPRPRHFGLGRRRKGRKVLASAVILVVNA